MKAIVTLCLLFLALWADNAAAQDRQDQMDRIRYGSKIYDNHREVTYWGYATLSLSDYVYGAEDAERLKLLAPAGADAYAGRSPSTEIQDHFKAEFKRLFGDIPFHDLDQGSRERISKHMEQNKNLDYGESVDRFRAAEEARRRSLYGGRAGSLFCNVQVKRRDFPVLYVIVCNISAEHDLRHTSWDEVKDIGFSSPEHIAGEIKRAITEMLTQKSQQIAKIRKYRTQQ